MSRRAEIKAESPCSVLDLTSPSIDRDEPRLEDEVQRETHIGIDSVIAVHDAILASTSSSSSEAPTEPEASSESTTEALVISASTGGRTKRQPVELSDKPPSKKR